MRALLALVAGGPGRVSTSAAAIVTCAFPLAGSGGELLRAAWHAFLWAGGFVLVWAVLAIVGNAAGVADGEAVAPASRETDHG
ncbi:hypothetical protein [Methylorubrum sp. GM97]|uniref:hypothetical protein n=1 Tax=Methylorubrum sp. GM97 TaxID=2938232 RepID=UPI002185C27A|nr:hypothetical protein [Methylorubrum sp. GM97]BDL39093.1 hypothetical protein MSPGM_16830 [Methylorubrum sp. GM97]